MAFFIENDVIYLTKGDDAVLEVGAIVTNDGGPYEIQDGDILTFTVRQLPSSLVPALIQIDSEPGNKTIIIGHDHTSDLNVGLYSADLQLTTSDGLRYTIWPKLNRDLRYVTKNFNNFVIMPEVTTI